MSIWQNKRYRDFEDKAPDDMLRGEQRRDFPWEVASDTVTDRMGDVWQVDVQCLNLTPQDSNSMMEAQLQFSATCELGQASMERLGFDGARIVMLDENCNRLQTIQKISLKVDMPKLETTCKALLSRFTQTLPRLFTDAEKAKQIRKKLEERPFCRFTQ